MILPVSIIVDLLYNYKTTNVDIQIPVDMAVTAELMSMEHNKDDIMVRCVKKIKRNILDIDVWDIHRIKTDVGYASPYDKYMSK